MGLSRYRNLLFKLLLLAPFALEFSIVLFLTTRIVLHPFFSTLSSVMRTFISGAENSGVPAPHIFVPGVQGLGLF